MIEASQDTELTAEVGQGSLSFRVKVEVKDFERNWLILGQVGSAMNVARYSESEPSYMASIS